MKLKRKLQMYKEFGFKVAFSSACSSALRHPMAITHWKNKCITDWLRTKYSSVIQKHRQKFFSTADNSDTPAAIWSIWWQGEDSAPELVKMCFSAINRYRGSHPFKIITRNNFKDYIDLPEHIIRKVQGGIITLTHLSDIIRFYLLAHYGGLWLDATILPVRDIPAEIFSYDYYVIRHEENPCSYGVNRDRWISFLQAAKKGSPLCTFGYDFLAEYWKEQTILIDYMLIDYALETAYQEFPEYRNFLQAVPMNNPDVDNLRPILGEKWDSQKFAELSASTDFFKLTYKHTFSKAKHGQDTFYGHFIRSILGQK